MSCSSENYEWGNQGSLRTLLDEEDAKYSTIDKATKPVVPKSAADNGWENQTHEEDNLEIVAMLPLFPSQYLDP